MAKRSDAGHEPRTAFFFVKPEDAGHPKREGSGGQVLCLFDTWFGDDLVSAHPVLLVTTPLKEALESLQSATGFCPDLAQVSRSRFLRYHNPDLTLPSFWALNVEGEPGVNDMGLSRDGSLVVSQRVMDVLVRHRVGRAVFSLFSSVDEGDAVAGAAPQAETSDVPFDSQDDQREPEKAESSGRLGSQGVRPANLRV